jgi:tetratricopeptide (TPR) repeat protein
MLNIETITRLLSETKISTDTDIHRSWSPMMQLFIPASKAERGESASAFYQWAEENADEQPLKFYYAQILLGTHNLLDETHESAFPLLLKARNGCEQRGDRDGVAMSSLFLGLAYRTMGSFGLALKTLLEPFTYFKQTGRYPFLLEGSCNSLANVNLQLHNYEEAFSLFQTGYETGLKIGDVFFPALALNGMGKAKMLQDKPDEAMEYFNKALQEAQKVGNPMQIGDTLIELAALNFRRGNFAVAEQLNKQAIGIHDGIFPGAEITCRVNLGEIYLKQSRWSISMSCEKKYRKKTMREKWLTPNSYSKRSKPRKRTSS